MNLIAKSTNYAEYLKFGLIDEVPVVGKLYETKEKIMEMIMKVTEMHGLIFANHDVYRYFTITTSKDWKYDEENYSIWFVAVKRRD